MLRVTFILLHAEAKGLHANLDIYAVADDMPTEFSWR